MYRIASYRIVSCCVVSLPLSYRIRIVSVSSHEPLYRIVSYRIVHYTSPRPHVSTSPLHPASTSPRPDVSTSPHPRVSMSPRLFGVYYFSTLFARPSCCRSSLFSSARALVAHFQFDAVIFPLTSSSDDKRRAPGLHVAPPSRDSRQGATVTSHTYYRGNSFCAQAVLSNS